MAHQNQDMGRAVKHVYSTTFPFTIQAPGEAIGGQILVIDYVYGLLLQSDTTAGSCYIDLRANGSVFSILPGGALGAITGAISTTFSVNVVPPGGIPCVDADGNPLAPAITVNFVNGGVNAIARIAVGYHFSRNRD